MSSTTQTLGWTAGVVGAFAVGLLVGWRVPGSTEGKSASTKPATTHSATGDSQDVRALREEVARLRAELRRGKRAAHATEGTVEKAALTDDAPVSPPTPEQEAAWLAARAQFYDKVLKDEPRNDAWAEPIEDKAISVAKTQAAQGVKLEDVRCYTNHCRMEYSYRDSDARTEHLSTIATSFTELQRVSYAYPGAPAVQNRAVLYMSTTDHPMPEFDYDTFHDGVGSPAKDP